MHGKKSVSNAPEPLYRDSPCVVQHNFSQPVGAVGPGERLSAEDIAKTYAVRWEIEILFRQIKSQFRLEEMPSASKVMVHALRHAGDLLLQREHRILEVLVRDRE